MASADAWYLVKKLRDQFLFRGEPSDEDWAELIDEAFEMSTDFEWEGEEDGEIQQTQET